MPRKPKSTPASDSEAPKKRPARTPPPKKTATPVEMPLVDTDMAAAAAAAAQLVAHRKILAQAAGAGQEESAAFKHLKESVAGPKSAGDLLGNLRPLAQKKSSGGFTAGNQTGHSQTFGDAARKNLPRRTNG